MAEDLKDILSHLNKEVSQETLLRYLKKELGREEEHEVERQLLEDPFYNDAVEGLQDVENPERLLLIAEALNRDLKKRTEKKRKERSKRHLQPQWWLYFSILILLILLVLIYLLLHGRMPS
ncbi:hypothetical protein LL912_13805 [Niabella sp. CC-SYL272]|uniref:hypothetical protein n=1 Tax=Niabella agricola TaxID=2891571 RepID=UPI001F2595C0|nr:hypothetical protein [Niabella agricola]MCF3109850.1 hypothetical protein [Niabella agricola]